MKKMKRWFSELFEADCFNDLDMAAIGEAFNDASVRTVWLFGCMDEIKRINLEVDKRLLAGSDLGLIDLCAKRKAYQDILESILSAKRTVTQEVRHNPRGHGAVDLDRVTA